MGAYIKLSLNGVMGWDMISCFYRHSKVNVNVFVDYFIRSSYER